MKKLLALLMAFAMMFTFTACGGGETGDKENPETNNETEYTEILDEEEDIREETAVPEGWEQVDIDHLPEGMTAYFNPDVLRYVQLSGGFSNAKGTDSLVVSLDIITDTTAEDYINRKYDALVSDTMNPRQNVVKGEIETSTCAGYTIYKTTISYDLKQYDMSSNTDKSKEYTPEEMDKLFPVIWEPNSTDIELVEIADGVYMKINVIVGEQETFLGAIMFEKA